MPADMTLLRGIGCLLFMLLLAGCEGGGLLLSDEARADAAARLANPPLQRVRFATRSFDIAAYYRQGDPSDPRLGIFIEGDGEAYISRYQRSGDPTPGKPVALDLAARHPLPNLLYLARPCQFIGGDKARNCVSEYWTTHRFAPETVAALNEAIDQYVARFGARRLQLYGYSGGALMALLLAGSRNDIESIVTVSGLLDHQAWTSHFGDTPLFGSRNSTETAAAWTRLPQRHFVGSRDKQVPPELTFAALRRYGLQPEALVTRIDDADHDCCWAKLWPQLSRLSPVAPQR